MGQAMATMFWRLLGREPGGNSLLCHHNDAGETSDSFFRRLWRIWGSIIRRLLGDPPSDPPSYHTTLNNIPHFIVDIGIDHEQVSEAEIREVAIRVAEDYNVEDKIGKLPPPAREEPPINNSRRRRRRRKLGPYSLEQKILLVGEGDFSFSASLAVAFGDASNMIATSLDSFDFLLQNYGKAANILELTSKSCKVMHGVNATKMANHPQLQSLQFDCIVYNFPHAGFSNLKAPREEQIRKHQKLVRGFLANAKKMIKEDGQIHITHKCVGFSREWDIEMLGSSQGLHLVEESPFNLGLYPGYNTKYGYGGDKNFDWKPAKTYKFGLANSSSKKKRTKKNQNKGSSSST